MRRIELQGRIALGDAEATVGKLAVAPEYLEPLQVDLSNAVDVEIGAGPRIGNVFRRYAQRHLEIVVPFSLDEDWKHYFSKRWRLFSRSGLGLAIATHAAKIATVSGEVTKQFQECYLRDRGEVGQNLIVIKDIHAVTSMNVDDRDAFTATFFGYLPRVNVAPGVLNREDLAPLIDLCREAILNVRDHSFRKPLAADTRILSYFSLRYYQKIFRKSSSVGPFKQYLNRLEKGGKSDPETDSGYLEIVINDDGVGVAGRQSQTEDVYWGRKDEEEAALIDALRTGGSIKPIAMDSIVRGDPGYGFSVMANSLRKLCGFASLRTGRFLAYCDGTDITPLSTAFSISRSESSNQLGHLPGTLIQAVVPIRSPQSSLSLR